MNKMVHKPVEKNLKHKTDVLSWSDIPWEDFDLNFRPPSASQLRLTTADAWKQLAVVAGVTVVALAVGERWISQTVLRSVTGMEVCCVAAAATAPLKSRLSIPRLMNFTWVLVMAEPSWM